MKAMNMYERRLLSRIRYYLLLGGGLVLFFSCIEKKKYETPQQTYNTLTANERQQGWKLLFDGKTTHGIRNYLSHNLKSQWIAENGTLHYVGKNDDGRGGDVIITDRPYSNFEFSVDWKISDGGNSGIIYLVVEDEQYEKPWHTGLEYQLLDNQRHADGQIDKRRAGDLYDLVESDTSRVKPAGEWNRSKIKVLNGQIEHWLNGYKILEVDKRTLEWDALVADSKFSSKKDFAKAAEGHIVLQDHGDEVWFRNIKVRGLSVNQGTALAKAHIVIEEVYGTTILSSAVMGIGYISSKEIKNFQF